MKNIELQFVVIKFKKLPLKEKERVYSLVKSNNSDFILEAGQFLLGLLIKNPIEMGIFTGLYGALTIERGTIYSKAEVAWNYFDKNLVRKNDKIEIVTPK